ncbi:MAG: glycosyltransferase, partial [Desulfamplus sp.]|nr:glycosyltransferase [Desulfamplus sp.]
TEILGAVYAGSDYFIMPSYADNVPCTIIESLSAGTPCIAYETGGIPEIISHIDKCEIVEVGNKQQLKQSMTNHLQNKISQSERSLISKNINIKYSQDLFINKHCNLYFYTTLTA